MKTFVLPIAALCLLVTVDTTSAATRTVTNLNDSGPGSLRDAIAASGSGDTINFAVTGTIVLTSASLSVNHNLTIQGPGANSLTIRRSSNLIFRIFYFDNGTWTLSDVTITNGNDSVSGCGIYNGNGNLTLNNCIITHNLGAPKGGGIGNNATTTMNNCFVMDNFSGNQGGGGIFNSGTLTMNNCTVSNNNSESDGGGLYNTGKLTVNTSTFDHNSVPGGGAAIFTANGGIVRNCTFYQNSGTSAIRQTTLGFLTVQSCTFSGDTGHEGFLASIHLLSDATTLKIGNTILDDLPSLLTQSGSAATITSLGYNLSRDAGNGYLTAAGDQRQSDLGLDPYGLQYNGGYTDTIALIYGSAAIDAGKSFGLTTDQRGQVRPYDNPNFTNASGGDGSDIGAYEAPNDPLGHGNGFIVTTSADHDDGQCGFTDCTLREAINRANSLFTNLPRTIGFGFGVTGTITLQSELQIYSDMTITGPGARQLAISGGATTRVFDIVISRGEITGVTISGLTIQNGNYAPAQNQGETRYGGGIFLNGTLTCNDCAFVNNGVSGATNSNNGGKGGDGEGGAIFNAGYLTLNRCTFSGNSAIGAAGTAFSAGGTLGAGGNGGSGRGGAIFSDTGSALAVTNCTFYGNTASGGAGGAGSGAQHAAGGDGIGAAIFLPSLPGDQLSFVNDTISGNTGTGGLGFGTRFSHGPNGGSNGGIFTTDTIQPALVRATIVAGNYAVNGNAAADAQGPFSSGGFNLIGIGDQSSGWMSSGEDQVGTTAAPINPQLGPLQNNGGPTDTMALLPTSTAIDQGSSFLTTDQRGQPRRFNNLSIPNASGGDGSDIGAFELYLVTPTSVVSQKTHGAAGNFNIKLPLTGKAGVECRKGGTSGVHKLIFTFHAPVTVGSAKVTPDPKVSGATATLSSYVVSGSKVTVNLTGVSNAQTIRITLSSVSDGTSSNDVSVPMGVLLGDTNKTSSVTSDDVTLTQSKVGQAVNATSFREDVTVDGSINSTDVNLVQSKVGTVLP